MQIYFLCTGNACRSQIAEGFAKKLLPPDWLIASAGIETHGLNPNAVAVMAENGIDISAQKSKLINLDYLNTSDLVVTLCGDANDNWSITPKHVRRIHWDLTDPAQVTGSDAEIHQAFVDTRDTIENLVKTLNVK